MSSYRVMVTHYMSKLSYTSVIFVNPKVKADGTYYCDFLLSQQLLPARGVARNLLRGTKEGSSGRKSPSGVQGQSPGGVCRRSPHKLETHAEYSTEQNHRSSQIAYCSESDYSLKKISRYDGGGHGTLLPAMWVTSEFKFQQNSATAYSARYFLNVSISHGSVATTLTM